MLIIILSRVEDVWLRLFFYHFKIMLETCWHPEGTPEVMPEAVPEGMPEARHAGSITGRPHGRHFRKAARKAYTL